MYYIVPPRRDNTPTAEPETVRPDCQDFKIAREPMDRLADDLFCGGMPWEAAVDEAFDYFLRRAGDTIFRVGEVAMDRDYAHAQCVRAL